MIEDRVVSLDEENALSQYISHFDLTKEELNRNGAQTSLIQAAVIRDITQGIVPQRQTIEARVPFNLMKSEQLVWIIQAKTFTPAVAGALLVHWCSDSSGFDNSNDSRYRVSHHHEADWSLYTTREIALSVPPNNDATGTPDITGRALPGQTLTAGTGNIADADGLQSRRLQHHPVPVPPAGHVRKCLGPRLDRHSRQRGQHHLVHRGEPGELDTLHVPNTRRARQRADRNVRGHRHA